MPDRIIKESICTSDTLNALPWFEQVFFHRLTVVCDDYGRFDARPKILKSRLFPLRDDVGAAAINAAIQALHQAGLIQLYQVEDKPYLYLTTWNKYQRVRAKRSKYPPPDDTCCHLTADDVKCPRNPIQSESNPNPNPNTEDNAHTCANSPSVRHKYGEYKNVLLSDEDMQKLKNEFPDDYQQRIERLSAYIASKGAKYKNHLATIRNWAKREEQAKKDTGTFGGTPPSYDLEELAKRGMYVPEI